MSVLLTDQEERAARLLVRYCWQLMGRLDSIGNPVDEDQETVSATDVQAERRWFAWQLDALVDDEGLGAALGFRPDGTNPEHDEEDL